MEFIPVYKPSLSGNEKEYLLDCLNSSWISSKGKYVNLFEKKFAEYIGVKHAISVCNGTVAVHLALLALGIGSGDEVIVPTFTYIATVNPIVYCGAQPIFVDSLKESWQINPKKIEEKITSRTKAIIVPHLYGHPADMDRIMNIAKINNLFVIEDCAEAIGSLYAEKHVGNFGDVGTFSFYGNKTITTGEGGMVVTNKDSIMEKVVLLKGQGLTKNREYWHEIIGYNYRLTNVACAIGVAQLERINNIITKKRQIASWYKDSLESLNIDIEFHEESENVFHSYWMCSILLPKNFNRGLVRSKLLKMGIETRPTFNQIHLMPMYNKKNEYYEIAEDISCRGMNLPSWPGLKKKDVEYIVKNINKNLN